MKLRSVFNSAAGEHMKDGLVEFPTVIARTDLLSA
jgi:hypothetical protein